ncbi:MAG: hypothetical protein ACJ77A_11780 [Actinomycetota bacterium]
MRRTLMVLVLAAVTAMPALSAMPAQAASAGTCTVKATVTITPGISMRPTKGTVSGSGGTIACTGLVRGVVVAGPGKLAVSGTYGTGATRALQHGDTCGQGSGSGSLTATLPKAAGGTMRVLGTFTFVRVGPAVEVNGRLGTSRFAGTLGFGPKFGQTCATVRVTSATVAGAVGVGG